MRLSSFIISTFVLFALMSFVPIVGFSQSLTCTEGLSILDGDLLARTNPRLDQNGDKTGVIKVYSTLKGLEFKSTYIVGDIAYEAGQYTIYIAQGAKNIDVLKEGYIGCKIVFANNSDIKVVQSQTTYKLVVGETRQLGTLSVTSTPSGAEVWFDEEYKGTTPLTTQVQIGKHNVSITKEKYASKEIVVDIKEGKETTINEKLSVASRRLRINTDDVSSVYIDEQFVGYGTYSGELASGAHTIKVVYQDEYISHEKSESIKLQDDKVLNIFLLGSLVLDESNQSLNNINLFLKAKGKGKNNPQEIQYKRTPNLYGPYEITVQRTGYWSRRKNINVHENEKVEYKIPKLLKNQRLIFLNYQFSPKGLAGGMIGWCNKVGVYVSGRANLKFSKEGNYLFGIDSWCVNAGPMVRCTPWLYLNIGVGYGTYNSTASSQFNVVDTKGFDAEIGLNFVVHGFTFNIGYNTICNKDITVISPLSNLFAGIGFAL